MPTDNRPLNAGIAMVDDVSRMDGAAKVTGHAKYGRDVYPKNAIFVRFIRCPLGAAKLAAREEAAATAIPGVLEIVFEREEGRYHGHVCGWIAADSPAAALSAHRALACRWEAQPFVRDVADGVPAMPEANEATAEILGSAAHVIDATYATQVQTHASLETHGATIEHDGQSATCYISTQGTFAARDGLGDALGLDRSKFEVVCEYVGGGFGSKLNGAGKEGITAAKVAAKYKRPVYLFLDREEDQVDTGNRPSSISRVKIGVSSDGSILGGIIHTCGGVGASRGGGGIAFPSGRYSLGKIQQDHQDVQTTGCSPRPFRAPGCPPGAFAEELLLDEIAHACGRDPLELRLRLDTSAERRAMYERGAKLIGWSRRRANGAQKGEIRRGFGMGSCSWGRYPSGTEMEVVIHQDGTVEARTGTQDIGTGQRTAMAIVASAALGVPVETVNVRIGRSTLPTGPGSGGSVTLHNCAPAMRLAAEDARRQFLEKLAAPLGGDVADLSIREGHVERDGKREMSWTDACRRMGAEQIVGRGAWNMQKMRDDPTKGTSDGAQFVELNVDCETGVIHLERIVAVQACGQVVCRKTAESQIIGGVIQGLSYALFENRVIDRHTGRMLNANLEWYKIAGIRDMPRIEPVLWKQENSGPRPLGEPPTIPTAGAIACALFNALGVPVRSLPLTPDRVLAALKGGVV